MRLEFSHKIIGSFLGMAILSVLVGYFAFVMTKNVQRVSRAIMKENVSSLKAAEELELALLSQKGLVSSYLLDTDSAWLKTLEEKKQDFDMWFNKAKEVAITNEEKNILQEIIGLYNIYDAQRNKAIRLYQTGNTADAKRILLTDMKNSIDALYGKCEDLILANEALIAKAETFSQKNAFMMTNLIWITIAVTLCFGALTGFFIARRINEQLIRSAKMASLGQLAAGVAHEIRNPLTSIKMRLYSLGEGLKNVSAVQEDIGIISEEIHRMEKTVKNFLDFARPPEPRFEKCDLQGIIEGAVELLFPKAVSLNVRIQKKFNAGALEVEVDKEQIRQMFLNIMLNAVEAMLGGGVLEIITNRFDDRSSNPIAEIKFKDTGTGISDNCKDKIFEPFFTTKAEGIGLGLFIAFRIAQAHKGKIEINNLAKGTAVIIRLPIT